MNKNVMMIGAIAALALNVFAQGSLAPSGAPGATMKTLDQVESRTPLIDGSPGVDVKSSGTFIISQSGSYYLTENLTVTAGWDGIRVLANGVTLDLNGFTIRSTSALSSASGINIRGSCVSVCNGHIESGTTYDAGAPGDRFSGPGFDHGIRADRSNYKAIRIRNITVSGVDLCGIDICSDASLVDSCVVHIAGSTGINAGTVRHCRTETCGNIGIEAATVDACTGRSVGSHGISATVVANSYGHTTAGGTTADGILAQTVHNSEGSSTADDGIAAAVVVNCFGSAASISNTSADGINAYYSVQNSRGFSACGDGITTSGAAGYCFGNSTGSAACADGIQAYIAVGCAVMGGKNITHAYNMLP